MPSLDRLEGERAFKTGLYRHENPYEPNSEAWMGWMDGFDHARARAEHPLSDTDPTSFTQIVQVK